MLMPIEPTWHCVATHDGMTAEVSSDYDVRIVSFRGRVLRTAGGFPTARAAEAYAFAALATWPNAGTRHRPAGLAYGWEAAELREACARRRASRHGARG